MFFFFFKSLLFNCFFFIYFLLLLFWFVLSLILFVSVCVSVSCPLTFCLRYKNNSPILCQLFWPTSFLWQPFSEMFLEFTIFSYIWKSVSKIHEKCGTIGVHSQGSFLTASSRKHIFMHFTHIRRYYYDKLL